MDTEQIIREHDLRTEAIRKMQEPLFDRLKDIEAKYESHKKDCQGEINEKLEKLNMKLDSITLHITETKFDINYIKKGFSDIEGKVNRHEKYFNMVAGAMAVIGASIGYMITLVKEFITRG